MAISYDESIIASVKDALGVSHDDASFDTEIFMDINSALATLNQVGCGKITLIKDETVKWTDFADASEEQFGMIQQFVFVKVKILFDPPLASTLAAFKEASDELLWRIEVSFDRKKEVEEP